MTRQEKILKRINELNSNFGKSKIREELSGDLFNELQKYGIMTIGRGADYDNTFDEIDIDKFDNEFSETEKEWINNFTKNCKSKNLRFKEACIEVASKTSIILYNDSIILNGDFKEYEIYLQNNSGIKKGIFKNKITLYGESYIEGGSFDGEVELYEKSCIIGGKFNEDVRLNDKSYIDRGIFNGYVKLYDNSYIDDGIFNATVVADDYTKINDGTFKDSIELNGDASIEGGIFNVKNGIHMTDKTVINDGTFNGEIYLNSASYISHGKFGSNCEVFLDPNWEEDQDTLNLLDKNGVKYEIGKYLL